MDDCAVLQPAAGLKLHAGVLSTDEQSVLLALVVDDWLAAGRAGRLHGKAYQNPPGEWTENGQGRECLLFGVRVKCNKVDNAAVEPLPPALHQVLDKLESRGVFTREQRPDTCCVNVYEVGSWLPPHVDSDKFARPFCTLSLLSEQEVVFGPTIDGSDGVWDACCRLTLPTGSVLSVDGVAANAWKHALPRASARRVSLTFRRLSDEARAHLQRLREDYLVSSTERQERRRRAKQERGRVPLDRAPPAARAAARDRAALAASGVSMEDGSCDHGMGSMDGGFQSKASPAEKY
jgi:alkylated DNA repair dioxygenase AlkB